MINYKRKTYKLTELVSYPLNNKMYLNPTLGAQCEYFVIYTRWIPAFLAWLRYYRQVSGTSLITWSVCCHVTGQDKSHPRRVSYVIALTMSTSTKAVSLIYRIFWTRFYLAFQIRCCELATLPTNMHYNRESTYISEFTSFG